MEENKRYLHIGCGSNILPKPFENLDVREFPGVDHVSPAWPLPFEDSSFDLVYSSHVLEHFLKADTQNVLNEWSRVLKPGGILRISVPGFESLIKIYEKTKDLSYIVGPLVGGQTYEQNFHYNVFDTAVLTKYLENAGCEAIHTWDYRRTSHSAFFDFSQATTIEIPISLNLEGRKKF
jgi:ubiquinone/menaquinone biosynthesis C-methylase UbiE